MIRIEEFSDSLEGSSCKNVEKHEKGGRFRSLGFTHRRVFGPSRGLIMQKCGETHHHRHAQRVKGSEVRTVRSGEFLHTVEARGRPPCDIDFGARTAGGILKMRREMTSRRTDEQT